MGTNEDGYTCMFFAVLGQGLTADTPGYSAPLLYGTTSDAIS